MQFPDLGVSGDGTAGAVGDGAFYDGSGPACQVEEKGELTVKRCRLFGFFSCCLLLVVEIWVVYAGGPSHKNGDVCSSCEDPVTPVRIQACCSTFVSVSYLVSRYVSPAPCR